MLIKRNKILSAEGFRRLKNRLGSENDNNRGYTMSVVQKADGNFVVEDDETSHTRQRVNELSQINKVKRAAGKVCKKKNCYSLL